MFGDLFGEDDEIKASGSTQNNSSRNGPPQPPLLRGSTGLAGIANQGATCYLNSLLQTLLFTPEFRESLFAIGLDELGNIADKEKPGSKVRVIPIHLQRLFARLLLLNQRCASTEELTDSFGWTNNEELQQHDVQELNRILFCAIEDSLVGTSGEDLISRLYRGSIVNQITCEECNRISERPEDFVDLTLAVGGFVGVVDTLRSCYVEEERMEGSNQYRCDRCQKLVNARKGAKLRSLPPILTLSLLRFSYDFVKLERYKETGHYTFPFELDMAPYCEKACDEALYELYSVVLHSGSTHGGHYHAYIRDVDNLGTWSEPENELIQLTPDTGSSKDDIIDMKSPQQCLSVLLRKHGGADRVLSTERLCQVLNQETGVSWNKRFKRQYGTLTKFLRKYSDLFELNAAGTLVHLVDPMKDKTSNTRQSPSCSPRDGARQDKVDKASESRHGTEEGGWEDRDKSNKEKAIARATSKIPEPGQCWYDFNDSSVQPIRESALQRQFQGRESAYMLLYRRKTMPRPKEAFNNAYHEMPAWLMAEIETANQELDKQREEYDLSINSVELSLVLSCQCTWSRGALQLTSGEELIKITLDRRKTITHLMELIKEQVPQFASQNECLHIAKELPAGLHLFDCLTDTLDQSLQDCYVVDNSYVFLWDGKEVDGSTILVGPNSEPILLLLTYNNSFPPTTSPRTESRGTSTPSNGPKSCSTPTETPHGFPKDTRISELRCMVSDIIGIPGHRLKLSRVQSTPVVIPSGDDGRTLVQMGFSDGDKLVVESTGKDSPRSSRSSLAAQEADRQKNSLRLTIENRCVDPNADGDWPVSHVNISKDKLVSELKQVIINSLGLYGNQRPKDGCRLRISDNAMGLLPPLHENQNLVDAGIRKNNTIVIETGLPPTSNELTLNFSLMCSTKSWDIMVNKTSLLSDCLSKMLTVAGMEDAPYHLRKTNWCGEAADIITEMDQSLADLHIQDGELLMLEEGRLPPKDHVLLPIWLYPTPPRTCGVEEGGGGGGGMSSWLPHVQISNIINNISSVTSPNHDIQQSLEPPSANQHEMLGQIEISHNATVNDLKNQIMTLPAMDKVVVPTVEFIRLRLLEDGRLGRVLRVNHQLLKYAKLNNSSQIAIQILPEEEQLRQTELVLTFQKRIPDTRLYSAAEELVWDAGKSAAPSSLRQAIADRLLIPVERVALAKHLAKKGEWVIIPEDKRLPETVKGGGGGRGKKKAPTAKSINLKQGPYNLKDGDVIGVVDLKDDPFQKDDFTTVEDDNVKERKQEEEEEKKRMRRDRRNAVSLGGGDSKEKKKRQEVGLTIKVDNFR